MSADAAGSYGDGLAPELPEALGEAEAYFNTLLLVEKTCREVFLPPLEGLLAVSRLEWLLIHQAQRVAVLLRGAANLPNMAYMPMHFAAVRTCFEIAVEVELLTRARQIFPNFADPEAEVVRRHDALMKRMSVKFFWRLSRSREPELSRYGSDILTRREGSAMEAEIEAFGDQDDSRTHWLHNQLAGRVKMLDEACGGKSLFREWYEQEYMIASQYVHGSLSPLVICGASLNGARMAAAIIYPWLSDFAGPHLFEPIWRRLRLDEADPKSWSVIRSMAERTAHPGT
jgi:hypothetical protein